MASFTINSVVAASQTLTATSDLGVITAAGSLVTAAASAVAISGNGASLVNYGLIASSGGAVSATTNFYLTNAGLISAEVMGVSLDVTGSTRTGTSIINTGDILSSSAYAISCLDAGLTIQNSGTITGRNIAISLTATDITGTNMIQNDGLISGLGLSGGNITAISCSGRLALFNTGRIIGDVSLASNNDYVDTRGGSIQGKINLGGGANVLYGGALEETVISGTGIDLLRLGGGDDDAAAGAGDDQVRGGEGSDLIQGEGGNDTLRGGLGDDSINGGQGSDRLVGNQGNDWFVFTSTADSPVATADRIEDFTTGQDRIDLSAMSVGSFTFVGAGAFLGGGAPTFGYSTSGSNCIVRMDSNGDAITDFQVLLIGVTSVALSDFILI